VLVMVSGSGGEPEPKRLNNSRDAEVTSLRKAGFTYAEISRKMGLIRERIKHIVAAQTKARKNSARDNPDALLTTSEATKLLNIRANTIRHWSNKGMLETYPIGLGMTEGSGTIRP